MKIVIASDSFKGSLSSQQIAEMVEKSAKSVFPNAEVVKTVIADGGEGTLNAIIFGSASFEVREITCKNPLFNDIKAQYAVKSEDAIIEMAQASGLTHVPYANGNAAITTSFGTGQLIKDAVLNGARNIFVAVGGSATNDGGIGALNALGFEFLDENGFPVIPIGANLNKIDSINRNNTDYLNGVKFTVLADVDNPFVGERGATRFFGKQKGAVGEVAEMLERGMVHFADIVERDLKVRLHNMPYTGAAGGLSGALMAFLHAEPKSGIDTLLKMTDFDKKISGADIIVTGEGRIDFQSAHGKAISGVCAHAKAKGVPVYAIVGSSKISDEDARSMGLDGVYTLLSDSIDVADAIQNAEIHLARVSEKLFMKIKDNGGGENIE